MSRRSPTPTRSSPTSAARSPTSRSPRRARGPRASPAGAGDDDWGRWLATDSSDEGVDLRCFELLEGEQTPVAFAIVRRRHQPELSDLRRRDRDRRRRGRARVSTRRSMAPTRSSTARPRSRRPKEREVTLRARELALDAGIRVCLDPNIRPNRWGGKVEPAAAASRELIAGSYLVRTNLEEAHGDHRRPTTRARPPTRSPRWAQSWRS